MASEPWKQYGFMYEHYVTRRMNLTDIQKLLKEQYGLSISPQALYNWAKRHDLLKFRGKGRSLKASTQVGAMKKTKSPMQEIADKRKREMRAQAKKRMGK